MVAKVIHNRTPGSGLRYLLLLLVGATVTSPGLHAKERVGFDPTPFQEQLTRYVKDGGVNYAGWKKDRDALAAFLDSTRDYDLGGIMGKEPKAAFLINAYNAWVVLMIVDQYPLKTVDEIPGMLDQKKRVIAGEEMTLDGIEKKLDTLLPHKPQFAIALARGTRGGPRLRPEAFTSENFDELLNHYTRDYLVEGKQVEYRREDNRLFLPPEVLKYMHRYEQFPGGLAEVFSNILPLEVIVALNARQPEYISKETDRSLNSLEKPKQEDTGENRNK